jgi:hypothetical protein
MHYGGVARPQNHFKENGGTVSYFAPGLRFALFVAVCATHISP